MNAVKIDQQVAAYLSSLETIRTSRTRPYNDQKTGIISDTASQDLDLKRLQPYRFYVLTQMSAVDETTQCTRIELYYVMGEEEFALNRETHSAAGVSVDWSGQIIVQEGTILRAKFVGGTSSDAIKVSASGYWIKP